MGLRFHRSLKILPGVRLNFSGSGVSTSIGVRGAHVTFGHGHVRETVGMPGTGISYTTTSKAGRPASSQGIGLGGWLVMVFVGLVILAALGGHGSPPRREPLPAPAPTTTPVQATPKVAALISSTLPELHSPMIVAVDALNERDKPNGNVVGVLHRGVSVDVYEQKDGWARITGTGKPDHWVSMKLLRERRKGEGG